MNCPEDVVQFVTEWWELSGNIATAVTALHRLKETYPTYYLHTFCHPHEVAQGAAAMLEICRYLETVAEVSHGKP